MKKLVLEGTYALSVLGSIQRFRSFDRDPDDASGGGTRVVAAVSKQCAPSTYVRRYGFHGSRTCAPIRSSLRHCLGPVLLHAWLFLPSELRAGRQGRKYCGT